MERRGRGPEKGDVGRPPSAASAWAGEKEEEVKGMQEYLGRVVGVVGKVDASRTDSSVPTSLPRPGETYVTPPAPAAYDGRTGVQYLDVRLGGGYAGGFGSTRVIVDFWFTCTCTCGWRESDEEGVVERTRQTPAEEAVDTEDRECADLEGGSWWPGCVCVGSSTLKGPGRGAV
ncbi:hypothetical protein FA13DRAFT_1799604 [Coprinellus micaceus]|uniref:Uncharacterized protein n=1 Tax=Coprinellus micaceus TaxID=71717 RepID=A0A4Y7SJ62_COPMI|nr:hypothetical protein FA13DRAFT_1799604 [Coprinellus micaceus]